VRGRSIGRGVWGILRPAFMSMSVANSIPVASSFSFSRAWRVKARNPHCESETSTL
jgi:hypothetical protein